MILVTGATGNIGPHVVRSLLERGLSVRAGTHVQPLDIDGIETCTIDFDQPETLPPALEGIDALFLLSSEVAHEEAMVAAARQAGVARIVYMSSFRADIGGDSRPREFPRTTWTSWSTSIARPAKAEPAIMW